MSERKVLNKYYPPDYDPTKLPKLGLKQDRQYVIRIMAPFNMRCKTCGEYIYKGKKFNARRETVLDEDYLGLRIWRFYIRCTKCVSEITFKTDPENTDYACEHGATRLFEAEKLAQQMAAQEKSQEEEDALNPMKVLENRTRDSRRELDIIDTLGELKELNTRHASIDRLNQAMLEKHQLEDLELRRRQQAEEDRLVRELLGEEVDGAEEGSKETLVRRLPDSDEEEEEDGETKKKKQKLLVMPSSKSEDGGGSTSGGRAATRWKDISVGGGLGGLKGLVLKKNPGCTASGIPGPGASASGTPASGTSTSDTSTSGTSTYDTSTSGNATSGTSTSGTPASGTSISGTSTSGTSGPVIVPNSPAEVADGGLPGDGDIKRPNLPSAAGGLSLIGGYSDSSDSD